MDTGIVERIKHSRDDGYLIELFSEKYGDFDAVHSYLVSISPGKTRAGHFHKKKTEAIFPVEGTVRVFLKDLEGREKQEISLDAECDRYKALLIPPNIAHLIENTRSSPAKIVVFSDSFDLEDTYLFEVLK